MIAAVLAAALAAPPAIGMAAPVDQWHARLHETGPVYARRVYGNLHKPEKALGYAADAVTGNKDPVISFSVPGEEWRAVARGKYDRRLEEITDRLAALPGTVYATVAHEPYHDGQPAAYAAMMRHVLPILSAPENVQAGPIVNGRWWSSDPAYGELTEDELSTWLPPDVIAESDFVAADVYSTSHEPAMNRLDSFETWARAHGVTRLGLGEYNAVTAHGVRDVGQLALDQRFAFACVFNSDTGYHPWQLAGSRLGAFQKTLGQVDGP